MIGVTRGISTLAGAAVAGVLLWFATQIGTQTSAEYWATYGLIAAAGLTMALSQILGGWTKWGWPRFSLGVFLIGFLPVLVAGGWVLLARQPADWLNTSNWSRDLGIYGVVADLGNVLPAIAFGIGLTFGFSFDTAGPRREVVAEEPVARDADAPLDGRPRHAAAGRAVRRRAPRGRRADGHRRADGRTTTRAEGRLEVHSLTQGIVRSRGLRSISVVMDAAAVNRPKPAASELLLEHCFALGSDDGGRPTAADAWRSCWAASSRARSCARARRRRASALAGAVLAAQAHEEEDRAAGDEREDQCGRLRDADGEHPDPEQEEEEHGPDEGLDALIDAGHAQMHRRDPSRRSEDRDRGDPSSFRVFAKDRSRPQQKNSESRWRFRPPNPLTFRFRVRPSSSASTYSRSVLAAGGT